jgi:hypothetical protein
MRQGGFTYDRIAQKMGYAGRSGAHKAVRQAQGRLGDAIPSVLEQFATGVEASSRARTPGEEG